MHCAADRAAACAAACAGARCLVRRYGRQIGACMVSACLVTALAACSPAGGPRHPGQASGSRPGPFARGRIVLVPGASGGFLALPAAQGFNGRPKIAVPPVPPATSGQAINLPLNAYAAVSSVQQTTLSEAQSLLTQMCMTSRGFVYTSLTTSTQDQALLQSIEYGFGITSLADAAADGYRQPVASSPQSPAPFLGGFTSFTELKQHAALVVALLGFAPGIRIGPIRQPGCLTVANNEIYRPGSTGLGDPVPVIAQQASTWTQTDPRILAADADWSKCMAQRGYHFANPQQAADHRWPSKPTAAETATAVADVSCKLRVNLANTWLTVEAAYQTALIGQNIATLANLQASFKSALNRVEALLASPADEAPALPGAPHRLLPPAQPSG